MREYKSVEPDQAKAYFFLAGLHKERGETADARRELTDLMEVIKKNNRTGYAKNPNYINAEQQLKSFDHK